MKQDSTDAQLEVFGRNLQRVRKSKGVTQEALAEMTELSARSIQRIEAGTMNILLTTALRLWRALGCDWEELYPRPGKQSKR